MVRAEGLVILREEEYTKHLADAYARGKEDGAAPAARRTEHPAPYGFDPAQDTPL